MGDDDQHRHDPLGDVINLFAAPIAGGIRSVEQFRRGIDELFRTIDNLNNTLETINEAAARVNRFMADIEEPVRTILPQLTRTVQAADELMEAVGVPARRIAPNLVQIVDTLGSPAFTTLPTQLGDFMKLMGDVSRRLGPLAQFAESAGGMFGFRMPGTSRSAQPARGPTPLPRGRDGLEALPSHTPATPLTPLRTHSPSARSVSAKPAAPRRLTTKQTTKKAAANKTVTKKTVTKKAPTKKTSTRNTGAKKR